MIIYVDFSDARKEIDSFTDRPLGDIGKELETCINQSYFNGADNATKFIAFDYEQELFEFEIMPC